MFFLRFNVNISRRLLLSQPSFLIRQKRRYPRGETQVMDLAMGARITRSLWSKKREGKLFAELNRTTLVFIRLRPRWRRLECRVISASRNRLASVPRRVLAATGARVGFG